MKEYFIYRLSFTTPVHFGSGEGKGVEETEYVLSASRLVSALFTELAMTGNEELLEKFSRLIASGELLFSDLFPYQLKNRDEEYYLPKPFLYIATSDKKLQEEKYDTKLVKKLKKVKYLRIGEIQSFLTACKKGQGYVPQSYFQEGESYLTTKVSCPREDGISKPYFLGEYRFAPNTGLYGLIYMEEEYLDILQDLLTSLGYSGIGGRRSSGLGKFVLDDDILSLEGVEDLEILQNMLSLTSANWQMNIANLYPGIEEEALEIVAKGQYQLAKISGFSDNSKQNNFYMLRSGSCFRERIAGEMINLRQGEGKPIWRYGRGMFVGLDI